MKVKIILILVFAQTCGLFAQERSFVSLKEQIKSDLRHLQEKTLVPNNERDRNFDEEAYCNKVAKKIQKLLTFDEARDSIDTKDFNYDNGNIKTLSLAARTNDKRNIRIYEFGYDCGGTRGWITHPIIQFTNEAGELFTYNMSSKINSGFFKIYPLQDDLYLLFGVEKGSGACRDQTAYVIQFKDNYLILDYPAFIDRPDINFCNVTFDFNNKTKVLTSKADPWRTTDGKKGYDCSGYYNLQYEYHDEKELNNWYSYLAIDINNGNFKLKFKNGVFCKMRKNNFDAFLGIYEE